MKQNKISRNPVKGKVVSISKDTKTIKVQIPRIVPDKTYGKRLHLHSSVFAHVEEIVKIDVGSNVEILPCRRISKLKSWKLVSIIS